MKTERNADLLKRAAKVVPNGMYGHQSTAMLPGVTPQFFARAKGTYLWDYDGNRFIDLMSAYGPNLFGYGHAEIDAEYVRQLGEIDGATGPSGVFVELAERFVDQVTHADWAMFCKNGTDATTMALMACRAHRGRRKVLIASGAYHGAAPWCTPLPYGVTDEERAHFIYYQYNDVESLEAALAKAGDDFAGVFATPHKHEIISDQEAPDPAYAKAVRDICDGHDGLMVVDDVRAGFRINRDCSWHHLGVEPDLSSWGKAIANGHPISCLLGSDRAREAAGKIFVTGSFWFAAAAMAASVKTLELIRQSDYLERTIAMGDRLRNGLDQVAASAGLPISQTGPAQMPLIMFNTDKGARDLALTYAFSEGMITNGVHFHPYHNMFINAAMTDQDIDQILEAAETTSKTLPDLSTYQMNPMAKAAFQARLEPAPA
ncbi:MAG: aminotransferase class III-fold pyridoxal phosphate-dependent enzyme [Henriciella sp.]|nr:aminotransferase class III-fold pyridoxal phosphate-dependent enzyme [Henriciella sp.]